MKKLLAQLIKLPLEIILIAILTSSVIWQYNDYFFTKLDVSDFSHKYSLSQYILGEASPAKVSDSELYVYASFAYMKGEDPTTINFEHPPLAKYYYGVFSLLFSNPYWGSLVLFALNLFLLSSIAGLLGLKLPARLLVIALFASLSLFRVHTRYALLDLPQLFGTLLFFYSYLSLNLRFEKKLDLKKSPSWQLLILMGISLSVISGSKYWFPWILIFIYLILWQAIKTKKYLLFLAPFLIAVTIYLFSYTFYFLNHHSLVDFLRFEKYRFVWFMGKTDAPKGLIFQTLFSGKYKLWWGDNLYEVTKHWSLVWPTTFLLSIVSFCTAFVKKNFQILLLLGYSYLMLAIFSIGSASSDRFFLQLLPFWILGSGYLLEASTGFCKSKTQSKSG